MESEDTSGLSAGNRSFIVTLIFLSLVLFGPAEENRLFYMIGVPVAAWAILRFVGDRLDIDGGLNDRIRRALTAALAGIFMMGAFEAYNASEHLECTRSVADGYGGSECIGDEVPVSGPDRGKIFLLGILACVAFIAAVVRKSD